MIHAGRTLGTARRANMNYLNDGLEWLTRPICYIKWDARWSGSEGWKPKVNVRNSW